jgi:glycosyltransferase involved in cell wall biosynthesis
MTYNHVLYIENALEGFSKQKTSFPFVAVVMDDASTDGNQDVILDFFNKHFYTEEEGVSWSREDDYARYYYARHKDHPNCFFAVLLLKQNQFKKPSKVEHIKEWEKDSKYIAMCEGDDYWTDPIKLQKQVEYLDCHPEIGLCYTDYNHLDQSSKVLTSSMFEGHDKYRTTLYEQFLLKPGYLAPMTWLFRSELSDLLKNSTVFSDGSYAFMLEFMQNSQVSYLPIVTATYRSHAGSVSSPTNVKASWSFFKGVFDTQLYYSQKYPCSEDLQRRVKIQGYLKWLPIAIMADQHAFVEEARDFFESQDMDISLIISKLEEGEKRKKSYAYRIGKKLMSPFSFLRRLIG